MPTPLPPFIHAPSRSISMIFAVGTLATGLLVAVLSTSGCTQKLLLGERPLTDDAGSGTGGKGADAGKDGTPGEVCPGCAPCGNRALDPGEACDDGNLLGADGCSADCKAVEPGWWCRWPGKSCVSICGDGLVVGSEACDDGNTMSHDGCSGVCVIEGDAICVGVPSKCTKSICGNGIVEAGEACDKGPNNGRYVGDGTGCASNCTFEPTCRDARGRTQACAATCGDGVIASGEDCDDGNAVGGDGCSATCRKEAGFGCKDVKRTATGTCKSPGPTGACLELSVTYRDFKSEKELGGHPDFLYLGATDVPGRVTQPCIPNAAGPARGNDATARCWDMTAPDLVNGKPQLGGSGVCACQFTDFSFDGNGGHVTNYVSGSNSPLRSLMTLSPNPLTYPGGRPQWTGDVQIVSSPSSFLGWFSDSGGAIATSQQSLDLTPTSTGQYRFANQPHAVTGGFFPLDPLPPVNMTTTPAGESLMCNLFPYWVPAVFPDCRGDQYLYPPSVTATTPGCAATVPPGCPNGTWVNGLAGQNHNFWFTEELHLPFVFPAEGVTLQLVGNDDLFVFINGRLALDLGGTHERIAGRVIVDGATGNAQIIEGGEVDADGVIAACPGVDPLTGIKTTSPADCRARSLPLGLAVGSTYELAIFGANRHPTESNFDLTLGGFDAGGTTSVCGATCGDGVQKGDEECDCGTDVSKLPATCAGVNNDTTYGGCTTKCKYAPSCGDGHVDSAFGEECDLGPRNGQPMSVGTPACDSTCRVVTTGG